VFTITPLTEDSGATAGTFTLTFKTTDNINTATSDLDFSLTFDIPIDSSAETILLMKAAGNSANNAAITYQNSSDVSTGFTEVGDPQAGAFSPYRSGGYSFYAEDQNDEIVVAADADFNFGSGDFTIEYWIYPNGTPNGAVAMPDMRPASTNGNYVMININTSNQLGLYVNAGQRISQSSSTAITQYQWNHVALVRSGSTTTLYIDGTSVGTYSDSTTYIQGRVVIHDHSYNAGRGYSNGAYIRDFRIVKGTAVYTSAFTPPTKALTAISGTSLLCCHLPYIADGSSSNHTLTISGDPQTSPFGPYDYEVWSGDDHGGSVYFDGSDALENTVSAIGTSDFTFEGWLRVTTDGSSNYQMIFDNRSALTTGVYGWYQETDDKIKIGINSTTFASDNTVVQNAWYHWAIVRNSNACTFYLNGEAQTSNAGTSITTNFTGTEFNIGRNSSVGSPANGDYWYGYQGDFRYSKSARYTADFTPPTTPLNHLTNTELLMNNKSDANVYDVAAGTSLEATGAVSSTSVRKFSTSSSVYFDGTNDSVIGTETIDLGAGDFTIEFWYNHPTTPTTGCALVDLQINGSIYSSFLWYYATSDRWQTYISTNGTSWNLVNAFTTIEGTTNNQWYHYAIVRDGTTIRVYVDGVYITSNINVGTTAFMPSTLRIADWNNGSNYFGGYVQDLRISRTARYTGATDFTPPTAEFEL